MEKIVARIRALLDKIEANGCTEAEAMLAAAKARELMDLSMSVGRGNSNYEYVIYGGARDAGGGQKIVARKGFFATYSAAKRAGLKAAPTLDNADGEG